MRKEKENAKSVAELIRQADAVLVGGRFRAFQCCGLQPLSSYWN